MLLTEVKPVDLHWDPHTGQQVMDLTPVERTLKILNKTLPVYFSDRWNMFDLIIVFIYVITFNLRIITWGTSTEVSGNRPLAVAGYLYGIIALLLTLRAFGHVMEVSRGMGAIQIAVFVILKDLRAIFWLFIATILGFSLAMTKIFVVEKSFGSINGSAEHR